MLRRLEKLIGTCELFVMALVFSGLFSGCTVSSPATETPIPEKQNIEKSFFIDPKGKPKTFLCGWASESEVGSIASIAVTHNAPIATHCNIEFEITENALVGKRINPSFPNDSKRWSQIVSIPISKHYYYEKAKDENGRDRNVFIENDSRSHWSARPFMKLELSHMKIHDWAYSIPGSGESQILSVEDIEWDAKVNFLGFTVVTNDSAFGAENQGRYRINFSEFKHNPSFKKTPFNDKNYALINVLHVVGEKADGLYPILHAAHWDLSKLHDVYLNDFPEEYVSIAEDIIKEWNETLVSVKAMTKADVDSGKTGFRINKTKLKHSFDLRYSSITWVGDMKISHAPSSPLGIALTQADVQNGEIVWGGVTLYGGYLEQYIKAFANVPSVVDSSSETAFKVSSIAKSLFSKMGLMQSPSLPHGMDLSGAGALSLQKFSKDYIDSKMKQSKNETSTGPDIDSKIQLALQRKSQEKLENLKASNREENFQDYIVSKLFSSKRIADAVSSGREHVTGSKTNQEVVWSKDAGQNLSQEYLHNISNGSTICMDRTFSDMAPGWIQGLGGKKGDYREVLRSLIKELSIHEVGHFLGLGHNFKENILPERGSVPESIYESLAKKATYEEGYTQYSTVMGYRHPRSEMRTTYDEVKPGPSDRLVLAYLYTQKYSTYKAGDADFTFLDIPKDGVIPPLDVNSSGPKTSYFPQCNDITATFSLDPYCNRFDRGHNATEIVDHYFSDIGDNLEQSHFAFTDAKGGSPELNEARLWDRNLAAMGRIRMFYDFMRKTYRNEIDSISQDEAALYEFSSACKSGQSKNEKLIKMFTAKPELKELCIVNSNVVEQIRNLATKNLSEYTKIDSSTAYIPAGIKAGDVDSDYSHAFGSWSQLGSAPLKIPAIYALMAPAPWVRLSPRSNPLSTVATYQREDSGFSYSSLYPFEYTSAIAYAVRDNLKFSNLNGQDSGNQLGRVILALGGLGASVSNNERHIFRKHYLDNIKAQSEFSFSMVAILIEGIGAAKDPLNYVDRFQGYATDVYANKMSINEIYLLPNRQLIVQANDMFLYPISKLELLDDRHLLAFAYKLSYSHEFGDLLNSISVKNQFQVMHDQVMKSCLDGKDKNGVAQYFKNGNPEFQGFLMLPGLFASSASQDKFDASVNSSFDKYYKDAHTDSRVCDEAIGGLGLIISSAAIINGGWLPEAKYYLLNTF